MEALFISLMICGPVVVIGTAVYLWKQRASTGILRRRRVLWIEIGALLAILALDVIIWLITHQEPSELWNCAKLIALALAFPLFQLWRSYREPGLVEVKGSRFP